jgi:hypothetical protein
MTSGIIEILTDYPGVQSLVGQNEAADKYKVYPFKAPQGEKGPYIVVAKTANNTVSQGKEIESTLDYPTYDVLCYSKNFRTTEELHEASRDALDNMSSITAVCTFRRIWLVTDRDAFDESAQMYVHVATYGAEQYRTIT